MTEKTPDVSYTTHSDGKNELDMGSVVIEGASGDIVVEEPLGDMVFEEDLRAQLPALVKKRRNIPKGRKFKSVVQATMAMARMS